VIANQNLETMLAVPSELNRNFLQ